MINWLLDIVARAYYWVWFDFFQRTEPFTRQAARIVQRWPAFAWGVELVVLGVTAWLPTLTLWWLFLTVPVYLFTWWWNHHILSYCVTHKDDNPTLVRQPSLPARLAEKAGRRREHWQRKHGRRNVASHNPKGRDCQP